MEVGKYLEMLPYALAGAKTGKWEVRSRLHGNRLGHIAWFGRWRQYAFFPAADTVFNRACLDDIAGFIRDRMAERKT